MRHFARFPARCGVTALAAMIAALGACDSQIPPPTGPEARHPNGLRLTLPEGYRATPTRQGFIVEPVNVRRYPVIVGVVWSPGTPQEGDGHQSLRRLSSGRILHYTARQTAEAAGSGPAEYELSACERLTTGALCLHQTKQ